MQSWGTLSRFTERDTGAEPSKSGVIGLVCAALGKPRREEPGHADQWPTLAMLASLRMGVRIDRPGSVGVDFQTAGGGRLGSAPYGVARVQGGLFGSVMSSRYFLQDASFLVGLSGTDRSLLERLHEALRKPAWQLSLGRKSYLPSVPPYLRDGLLELDLAGALATYNAPESNDVRVVVESKLPFGAEPRMDQPLDFERRKFARRFVIVTTLAELAHGDWGERNVP